MAGGHGDLIKAELLRADEADKRVVFSDPSHSDNPTGCINEGFARQTRSRPETSHGRNCLFLRGLATGTAAIEASRVAAATMTEITAGLLKDRKVAAKSRNRLPIRSLFDERGELPSFIGAEYATFADAVPRQPIEAILFS